MNCNTCRYELSQCLDGRLPSGRRALVMQHATQCADCSAFWAELQAAQALTLRLRRPRVSADFRESLWQRIQAGEGTPDAVFHDGVPLLAKVRYALTGAAAAAAVLLCALWLRGDDEVVPIQSQDVAQRDRTPETGTVAITGAPEARTHVHQDVLTVDDNPLLASAQRLRFHVFALETARQLDQRFAATSAALRRLEQGPNEKVVEQALTNAKELHTFGEVLLDLHDRKRLAFLDADVVRDLRFATDRLDQVRRAEPDAEAVRERLAPVVARGRLAAVAGSIATVPLDPHEEMDVLLRINIQRPDVIPKLFYVLGNDARSDHPGMVGSDVVFFMEDVCGPSWVAPRSEVDSRLQRVQAMRARPGGSVLKITVGQPGR